jgi:hypothetical protein
MQGQRHREKALHTNNGNKLSKIVTQVPQCGKPIHPRQAVDHYSKLDFGTFNIGGQRNLN